MGINWHMLKFLTQMRNEGFDLGETATFGRLNLFVTYPKARAMFAAAGIPFTMSEAEYQAAGPYSEFALKALGARSVDSIDMSDYEGASFLADLNKPLPTKLEQRFDTCIDGGTIEHVFDVKLALQNQMSAVRKGGNLLICTMANNWFGHGFYQFGPDFFYRALGKQNGFRVQRLTVHEMYDYAPFYDMPDPDGLRSRIEFSNSFQGVNIIVHAVREEIVPLFTAPPQQSDYAAHWKASDEAGTKHPVATQTAAAAKGRSGGLRGMLKRAFPSFAQAKHAFYTRHPDLAARLNAPTGSKYHRTRQMAVQQDRFIKKV